MLRKIVDRLIEFVLFHVVRNAVVDLDPDTYLNGMCDKLNRGDRLPGEFGLLLPIELNHKLAARLLLRLSFTTTDKEVAARCLKLILYLDQDAAVEELTVLLLNANYQVRKAAAKRLKLTPDCAWDPELVRGLFALERTAEGKAILLGLLTTRPDFLPDFETESEMWHELLTNTATHIQLVVVSAIEAGGPRATCMIRQMLVLEREAQGDLRHALVRAIAATLTDQERAIKRIIELVNDDDPVIACTAIEVIPSLGRYATQAVPALTLAMLSRHPVRREEARKVLEEIGWESPGLFPSEGSEGSEGLSMLASLKRILLADPNQSGADALRLRLFSAA